MNSAKPAKMLTLLGLFVLCFPTRLLAQEEKETSTIARLQVVTRYPIPPPETFAPLIPLEQGQQKTLRQIRSIERTLKDSKLFRSVSVEISDEPGGVSLLFDLWQKERVRKVKIRGNWPVLRSSIYRALNMQEGEPFETEAVPGEVDRIKALYEKKGWYGTRVEPSFEQDPEDGSFLVEYRIRRGRRIRMGRIDLEGVQEGDPERIRKILNIRWPMVNRNRMDRTVQKVRDYYHTIGYPKARVSIEAFDPDMDTGRALLKVSIQEEKQLILDVRGNEHVASAKILRTITFFQNQGYGHFDAEDSAEAIQDLYETKGFPSARVTFERKETGREVRVTFTVDEGKKTFIRRILFEGNQSLANRELSARLLTRPRNLFLFRKGTFRRDKWKKDLGGLINQYMAEGFLDVKVMHELQLVKGRENRARLVVRIEEGPRYTVASSTLEGVPRELEPELRKELRLAPGTPFNEGRLAEEGRRVAGFYANRGYLLARVETEYTVLPDHSVETKLSVFEGPCFRMSGLVVAGNRHTRFKTIRTALRLDDKDPIYYRELAETRKRLYRLGTFDGLSIRVPGLGPDAKAEVDQGQEEVERPVLIEVRDKRTLGAEVGVRFDSDVGLEGLASVRHENLLGRARKVTLDSLLGQDRAEAKLSYVDPTLLAHTMTGNLQARYEREVREAYTEQRSSLGAGLYRRFRNKLTPGLFLILEHAVVFDVKSGAVDAPEASSTLNLFVRPQLVRDTRDNKLYPTKGGYGQIKVAVSNETWGSDDELILNELGLQGYKETAPDLTLASRFSLDHVQPYGRTEVVPSTFLLFAGGNNSVRGFPKDGLGPRDDKGNPRGGTTRILGNLEVRFPIYRAIKGVVFLDVGSLTDGFEEIDTESFRWATGAGVRLHTPVGPVRLEYGYQLQDNPPLDRLQIHFSLGFPF